MSQRRRGVQALRGLLTAALMAMALLEPPAAWAQTPNPLPEWYYSQGHLIEAHERPDPIPTWERVVGLSVETQPKYDGGNAYSSMGGPSIDIRYKDIAFISSGEGLGVNLLHSKTYRAGVSLAYDLGRDQDSDHHLHGLGDVGIAPEAKFFGEYLVFPVTFRVDARYSFGGQGGWIGDIGVYSPLAGNRKFFIFAGPSLTFADETNMRHNFGVTAKQAASSGYPQYHASAGLRNASFGISGGYFLTDNWLLTSMVAAKQLFGNAGHSPFVQEEGEYSMTFTVAYRW